jgi:hypothetical protein
VSQEAVAAVVKTVGNKLGGRGDRGFVVTYFVASRVRPNLTRRLERFQSKPRSTHGRNGKVGVPIVGIYVLCMLDRNKK